ncbi:MAG: Fe-S cluster assembly protein SufD [Holophagales bacterium]|jgi:Fe-S cluster assembly protein SufD|nr:Fe-S cluster assembly protein SufD [Holophagales bacterium]
MAENVEALFLQTPMSYSRPADWEPLRKSAEEKIRTSPLPTSDHEDWKYLDLSPVYSQAFNQIANDTALSQAPVDGLVPETAHSRLLFTNGRLNPNLSDTSALCGGIYFSRLAETAPRVIKYLGKLANPNSSGFFANINTARFGDGAAICVSSGQSSEIPLHVVFHSSNMGTDGQSITFPRILVVLEPGAQAHLIEEYCGSGNYLTNSVVEIVLGEGANLRHDRIQRESPGAFHFCTLCADIARSASYSSTTISAGAAIYRHDPKIKFVGEHAELELNGLTLINAAQTADTHSLIDHTVSNCSSRQLQKYIIGDSAHGIFNGQVLVRPGAQQTSASQSSRNLLLTENAKIDTKPQLEIYADDVKCGHGAAVGQLDSDELFYLQSRGLDLNSARSLLLAGFAADVLNHMALPSLRRNFVSILD